MQHARRIWPILTQLFVGTACLAGCHGREPLAVKLHDPLRANERDVTVFDAGEAVADASTPKPPRRRPSTDPPTTVTPPVPPTPAGSGAAGWGAAGVAGSRPTTTPTAGWGAAGSGATPWACGNGVIDPIESCEPTNLGGLTCAALGFEGGGLLLCSSLCSFDVSNCHLQPVGPLDAGQPDDDAGVVQP